ncbi:MAG: hypothetical protein HFI48_08620 [Lachnospiraceae bacterium]|nr:hypothetical protein [Lachnospiraceae bacterium]
MFLKEKDTVFDLLAKLVSLLSKEEERKYAIEWTAAKENHIKKFIDRYKNFLAIIMNASATGYQIGKRGIFLINEEMKKILDSTENRKSDIFRLVIETEKRIDMYANWQNQGVIYCLQPLNTNVEETDIAVYPHFLPQWDTGKSERKRERKFNAVFQNYMVVRVKDISPFEVIMHYWNDEGVLQKVDNGWKLRIGMSPVMDYAELRTKEKEQSTDHAVSVEGLVNEDAVNERVLTIFERMFSEEYGMIIFPEALGSEKILNRIKEKMREWPENYTFVAAPTICSDGRNVLVVLGPGGVECLRQEKTAPAILLTKDGRQEREELCYTNQVHLLITRELGLMAFAICAELLDPDYYRLIVDTVLADTIICASFSPGVRAFHKTLLKGTSVGMLECYINTCSAQKISRSGKTPEPLAFVNVPCCEGGDGLREIARECGGVCAEEICYFDIVITYKDKDFIIESIHKRCA